MKVIVDRQQMYDDGLTDDEIDEIVAAVEQMANDGTLIENSQKLDMDELATSDPELYERLTQRLEDVEEPIKGEDTPSGKYLH